MANRPKFFIPAAKDNAEAEAVIAAIGQFLNRSIPDQRIFRITYTHNLQSMIAEVGKSPDPYYQEKGPVVAILPGNPFYICLPDRGVSRGDPIFVGVSNVQDVEYFDDETAD